MVSVLFLSLAACNRQGAEIADVAKAYAEAVGNYDFEAAEPYVTDETRATTLDFFKKVGALTDTSYIRSNTPAIITIRKVNLVSDTTATVSYHKSTPISEQDDTLQLVCQQGRWLVDNVIEINPLMQLILAASSRKAKSNE